METPQALTPHDGVTLRMLWACCAADTFSPLSYTQRAAIWESLKDRTWIPDALTLPQTAEMVERWYAALQGTRRTVVEVMTTRKKTPDAL